MDCVMLVYPATEESTFDMDYYANTHMPMFVDRLGEVCTGWGVMNDHTGRYHAVAWAIVTDIGAFNGKMKEHGREIMADVENYTTSAPKMITGGIIASQYD